MTEALKIQKYLMDAPRILVGWLKPKLEAVSASPWNECVAPTLSALQLRNLHGTTLDSLDFNNLVAVMTYRPTWTKIQQRFELKGDVYDSAIKARGVRNKYCHTTANTNPSESEQASDCRKLERFLRAIGATESEFPEVTASASDEITSTKASEMYAEIAGIYGDTRMSLNDKVLAYARIMFALVKEAVTSDP